MASQGAVACGVLVMAMVAAAAPPTKPLRTPRQDSFLSGLMNNLLRSSSDYSNMENTADLGRACGYDVEEHSVVTDDGYILAVHHIPPYSNPDRALRLNLTHEKEEDEKVAISGRLWRFLGGGDKEEEEKMKNEDEEGGKVIFLQHGLMGSSDNWNTNTEHDSLAYLLSDRGYDVWMGNFRGNIYSRYHVNLSHYEPDFWRFSYDEMAHYDLPAMLDYVVNRTSPSPSNPTKVHYIGHSMGTTVFFALMSAQPEYQSRVASMVALAPVATITSITSPIKYLAPIVTELQFMLRLFGNDEGVLTNRMLTSLWEPYRVCGENILCENIQFLITGFDPERADKKMVPTILSHNPAGASTQTLFHFVQGFNSGQFAHYDLGKEGNMARYGTEWPPLYDVSRINLPVTLFWASNDWLTGKKDIERLEKALPQLQASYKVQNPIFSHLDFLWAMDARELVYDKLLEILEGKTDALESTQKLPETLP